MDYDHALFTLKNELNAERVTIKQRTLHQEM